MLAETTGKCAKMLPGWVLEAWGEHWPFSEKRWGFVLDGGHA